MALKIQFSAQSGIKVSGSAMLMYWRKKGQKFSKDRSDWSIYENFEQMYNEVYAAMVIAGVATELAEPIWVNKEQEETSEEEAFGRKVTHLLTRPDYVVFVDEVGSNLSQEGDGAVGGRGKQ
jgi:hypothetical protein